VGAIVWATGWEPYDAHRIDNLGFGQYDNIITNMMMERLASNGPTRARSSAPSDDKAPESVAFVQCAGSRDENHLPYCSYICCMASLKQATYVREQYPDAKIYIFYIDIRSRATATRSSTIRSKKTRTYLFHQGQGCRGQRRSGHQEHHRGCRKCGYRGKDSSDGGNGRPGHRHAAHRGQRQAAGRSELHEDGFIINDFAKGGMFAAGCANKPADVVSSNQNATGMALKAIQTLVKR
jgi:quinone-modifying oxidoreductase subunit QmoA